LPAADFFLCRFNFENSPSRRGRLQGADDNKVHECSAFV
jgi:hypothetical protein